MGRRRHPSSASFVDAEISAQYGGMPRVDHARRPGTQQQHYRKRCSRTLALGEAFRIIRRDQADFMLTGAADSKINPLSLVRQNLFAPLSRRKFAGRGVSSVRQRSRRVGLGRSAGMMAIEELEHARRRGARIVAEIVGFGSAFDRGRTGSGVARAVRAALAQAGIEPSDVDHVNAHGLSTPQGDAWEACGGLHEIFANDASVTVFAPKSYFGCLSAASSTTELIASVLAS